MKRRTKVAIIAVVSLVAVFSAFVFLPTVFLPGPCFGGSACPDKASLSCGVFGFGAYTDFYGNYFFTFHCSNLG